MVVGPDWGTGQEFGPDRGSSLMGTKRLSKIGDQRGARHHGLGEDMGQEVDDWQDKRV